MELSPETGLRNSQLAAAILKRLGELEIQVPLPSTHPESNSRTLQDLEAIGRALGLLPPEPHNPSMPDVTTSIGTTSRDYSTITAWEADLDNSGIYSSADNAIGECYNDSAFDEAVTINGGGTVGLASVKLSVASSERHDGTAGTGVSNVRSTVANMLAVSTGVPVTAEWVEWNLTAEANVTFSYITLGITPSSAATITFQRNLIHGGGISTQDFRSMSAVAFGTVSGATYNVLVNVIYDINHANGGSPKGISHGGGADTANVLNNTLHDIAADDGNGGVGINGDHDVVQNNLVTGSGGSDFSGTFGTADHNASSDTTATGTGSLTEIAATDQFVSTVGGSEDLHLKSGADCIDAGTDLGTTPTGVNIDIDGRDRDAEGDTWDIGADEFVAAPSGTTPHDPFGLMFKGPLQRAVV